MSRALGGLIAALSKVELFPGTFGLVVQWGGGG